METSKEAMKEKQRLKHLVKPGCDEKCRKKCTEKISEGLRNEINEAFWNKDWSQQKMFIFENVSQNECAKPASKRSSSTKSVTYTYSLRANKVCRDFF